MNVGNQLNADTVNAGTVVVGAQVNLHPPPPAPPPAPPSPADQAGAHHLKRLRQRLNALPLAAMGAEQDAGQAVTLEQMYVARNTQTRAPLKEDER